MSRHKMALWSTASGDRGRWCALCRTQLGRIINRGASCPSCYLRVCKNCRDHSTATAASVEHHWVCSVCKKHSEIQQMNGGCSDEIDFRQLKNIENNQTIVVDKRAKAPNGPTNRCVDYDVADAGTANVKHRRGKQVQRSWTISNPADTQTQENTTVSVDHHRQRLSADRSESRDSSSSPSRVTASGHVARELRGRVRSRPHADRRPVRRASMSAAEQSYWHRSQSNHRVYDGRDELSSNSSSAPNSPLVCRATTRGRQHRQSPSRHYLTTDATGRHNNVSQYTHPSQQSRAGPPTNDCYTAGSRTLPRSTGTDTVAASDPADLAPGGDYLTFPRVQRQEEPVYANLLPRNRLPPPAKPPRKLVTHWGSGQGVVQAVLKPEVNREGALFTRLDEIDSCGYRGRTKSNAHCRKQRPASDFIVDERSEGCSSLPRTACHGLSRNPAEGLARSVVRSPTGSADRHGAPLSSTTAGHSSVIVTASMTAEKHRVISAPRTAHSAESLGRREHLRRELLHASQLFGHSLQGGGGCADGATVAVAGVLGAPDVRQSALPPSSRSKDTSVQHRHHESSQTPPPCFPSPSTADHNSKQNGHNSKLVRTTCASEERRSPAQSNGGDSVTRFDLRHCAPGELWEYIEIPRRFNERAVDVDVSANATEAQTTRLAALQRRTGGVGVADSRDTNTQDSNGTSHKVSTVKKVKRGENSSAGNRRSSSFLSDFLSLPRPKMSICSRKVNPATNQSPDYVTMPRKLKASTCVRSNSGKIFANVDPRLVDLSKQESQASKSHGDGSKANSHSDTLDESVGEITLDPRKVAPARNDYRLVFISSDSAQETEVNSSMDNGSPQMTSSPRRAYLCQERNGASDCRGFMEESDWDDYERIVRSRSSYMSKFEQNERQHTVHNHTKGSSEYPLKYSGGLNDNVTKPIGSYNINTPSDKPRHEAKHKKSNNYAALEDNRILRTESDRNNARIQPKSVTYFGSQVDSTHGAFDQSLRPQYCHPRLFDDDESKKHEVPPDSSHKQIASQFKRRDDTQSQISDLCSSAPSSSLSHSATTLASRPHNQQQILYNSNNNCVKVIIHGKNQPGTFDDHSLSESAGRNAEASTLPRLVHRSVTRISSTSALPRSRSLLLPRSDASQTFVQRRRMQRHSSSACRSSTGSVSDSRCTANNKQPNYKTAHPPMTAGGGGEGGEQKPGGGRGDPSGASSSGSENDEAVRRRECKERTECRNNGIPAGNRVISASDDALVGMPVQNEHISSSSSVSKCVGDVPVSSETTLEEVRSAPVACSEVVRYFERLHMQQKQHVSGSTPRTPQLFSTKTTKNNSVIKRNQTNSNSVMANNTMNSISLKQCNQSDKRSALNDSPAKGSKVDSTSESEGSTSGYDFIEASNSSPSSGDTKKENFVPDISVLSNNSTGSENEMFTTMNNSKLQTDTSLEEMLDSGTDSPVVLDAKTPSLPTLTAVEVDTQWHAQSAADDGVVCDRAAAVNSPAPVACTDRNATAHLPYTLSCSLNSAIASTPEPVAAATHRGNQRKSSPVAVELPCGERVLSDAGDCRVNAALTGFNHSEQSIASEHRQVDYCDQHCETTDRQMTESVACMRASGASICDQWMPSTALCDGGAATKRECTIQPTTTDKESAAVNGQSAGYCDMARKRDNLDGAVGLSTATSLEISSRNVGKRPRHDPKQTCETNNSLSKDSNDAKSYTDKYEQLDVVNENSAFNGEISSSFPNSIDENNANTANITEHSDNSDRSSICSNSVDNVSGSDPEVRSVGQRGSGDGNHDGLDKAAVVGAGDMVATPGYDAGSFVSVISLGDLGGTVVRTARDKQAAVHASGRLCESLPRSERDSSSNAIEGDIRKSRVINSSCPEKADDAQNASEEVEVVTDEKTNSFLVTHNDQRHKQQGTTLANMRRSAPSELSELIARSRETNEHLLSSLGADNSPRESSGLANYFAGLDTPALPSRRSTSHRTPEIVRRQQQAPSERIIAPAPSPSPSQQSDCAVESDQPCSLESARSNFSEEPPDDYQDGFDFGSDGRYDYENYDSDERFSGEDSDSHFNEDYQEESYQDEGSRFNKPIDFTLTTIIEESCEESDGDGKSVNDDVARANPSELEKYFFFDLGNGPHDSRRYANEDSECSDTFSETSGSIYSEIVEGDECGEESYQPPSLRHFRKGFLGLNRHPSIRSVGDDSENQSDGSGSVGSDSEGKPSPGQRRKRVNRHRLRTSSADINGTDNDIAGRDESEHFPPTSSDEDQQHNISNNVLSDKHDSDTIKRRKKKRMSQNSDNLEYDDCEKDIGSMVKTAHYRKYRHDTSVDTNTFSKAGQLSKTVDVSTSRDSGFLGSSDDLLKETVSKDIDGINLKCQYMADANATSTKAEHPTTLSTQNTPDGIEDTSKKGTHLNSACKSDYSTSACTNRGSKCPVNDENVNRWSSDEETNILMCRLRQVFRCALLNNQDNMRDRQTERKPEILVAFENALTRLMKNVRGINDSHVRELVEYLSSEETCSDTCDSSDCTSSDLESSNAAHSPVPPDLVRQFKDHFSQSYEHIISSRLKDTGVECSSHQRKEHNSAGADALYEKLMVKLNALSISRQSEEQRVNPSVSKMFEHIGDRLATLMREVPSGESSYTSDSSNSSNVSSGLDKRQCSNSGLHKGDKNIESEKTVRNVLFANSMHTSATAPGVLGFEKLFKSSAETEVKCDNQKPVGDISSTEFNKILRDSKRKKKKEFESCHDLANKESETVDQSGFTLTKNEWSRLSDRVKSEGDVSMKSLGSGSTLTGSNLTIARPRSSESSSLDQLDSDSTLKASDSYEHHLSLKCAQNWHSSRAATETAVNSTPMKTASLSNETITTRSETSESDADERRQLRRLLIQQRHLNSTTTAVGPPVTSAANWSASAMGHKLSTTMPTAGVSVADARSTLPRSASTAAGGRQQSRDGQPIVSRSLPRARISSAHKIGSVHLGVSSLATDVGRSARYRPPVQQLRSSASTTTGLLEARPTTTMRLGLLRHHRLSKDGRTGAAHPAESPLVARSSVTLASRSINSLPGAATGTSLAGDLDRELASTMSLASTTLGSRSDSLVSVSSSSESARASAGGVAVRGQIQLSLSIKSVAPSGVNLFVHVHQCRDLAAVDFKRQRSDPYVKVYLLPDRSKSGKRKTKTRKHTLSPVFDEVLKFGVDESCVDDGVRSVWLTVWNEDKFGRNEFLGQLLLPINRQLLDQLATPSWYQLLQRTDLDENCAPNRGQIVLALKLLPAASQRPTTSITTATASHKSSSASTVTGGSLHVIVKEAKQLVACRASGQLDPFCKCFLLPDRRISKQKTVVQRRTSSPQWGTTFVYNDVTAEQLERRSLELAVCDHQLTGSELLGGVRLNLGVSTGVEEQWWMDASVAEAALWRHMLQRPGFWVEAALPLRAHLQHRQETSCQPHAED